MTDNQPQAAYEAEADDAGEMTPEQLAESKRKGQIELACDIVDRVIDLVFLAVMAFVLGGPAGWLMQWVPGADWPETIRLASLMLLLIVLGSIISFPLAFYGGFVLEHQFGLSRQTIGRWLKQYAKSHALGMTFSLLLICGLYWVIWLTGAWWWIIAAVAFFLITIVMGQLAPVLILPLFNKIEPLEPGERTDELNRRMAQLAEGTGLTIQGVYGINMSADTVKANAMLAGLGRTRRVIMGDNLLKKFTLDEIEVIFAHEVGHHVYRHIWKSIVMAGLYSLVAFWLCDRLFNTWVGSHGQSLNYHDFPVYTLPMMLFAIAVFSQLTEPLKNMVTRFFERQCDRYALDRTHLNEAYISAFTKLAKLNKDDPEPHPVEVFLFHSHPPIAERLAMATE